MLDRRASERHGGKRFFRAEHRRPVRPAVRPSRPQDARHVPRRHGAFFHGVFHGRGGFWGAGEGDGVFEGEYVGEENMKKYLELMFNFNFSELKQILGNDIVENLNEWDISSEEKWSRKKIIEMIDCLYGVNLLRDKKIIERILRAMPINDLTNLCRRFCQSLLEQNPDSICSEISGNWGNNDSSRRVLSELGVDENIFEIQKKNEVAVKTPVDSPELFYELLDYQFYIKQQALHILNSENQLARFLIHMPTGTGKTKTSMHIITNYLNFTLKKQGLVIWVAHTTELLQQAYETFVTTWTHLGDGEINAYRIWADNSIEDSDIQLNGIMFCGIQKLIALSKSDEKLFSRLVTDCRLFVFESCCFGNKKNCRSFYDQKTRHGKPFFDGTYGDSWTYNGLF